MPENDNPPTARIFIASSHTASNLAQMLHSELTKYVSKLVELVPVRWWDKPPGSYILSTLTRQTDECDFAAVLLTEGDITSPGRDNVRDNCIYEAGLFLGALGDPARCFLLASCEPKELPSDLAGLTYIHIVQARKPEKPEERNEEEKTIKQAAGLIGQAIEEFVKKDQLRAIRGLKLPIISVKDLARKEQPQELGGMLLGDTTNVFVNTPRPFEYKSHVFAKRIMSNMVDYGIDYLYAFEASRRNAETIAGLIAKLASVNGVERFIQNINDMRQSLQIYLVPDRRGLGLQYCIHNPNDHNIAVCYMRKPVLAYPPRWLRGALRDDEGDVEWMEWARGVEAVGIAEEITRMCIEERGNRIFRCTMYYNLYDTSDITTEAFLKNLWYKLLDQCRRARGGEFSENDEKVLATACFGETCVEKLLVADPCINTLLGDQ